MTLRHTSDHPRRPGTAPGLFGGWTPVIPPPVRLSQELREQAESEARRRRSVERELIACRSCRRWVRIDAAELSPDGLGYLHRDCWKRLQAEQRP